VVSASVAFYGSYSGVGGMKHLPCKCVSKPKGHSELVWFAKRTFP